VAHTSQVLACVGWWTVAWQGYSYDAAGNMMQDLSTGYSYTYDQENRITGAAGYTYTYDEAGNRVEKSNGTTGTLYWYMTPGIVAESALSGNLQSEYVFFDGERVARKDLPSGNIAYYFADTLKTASVITDAAGNIKSESDYYPWGGELQFANSDSNHYKFTGKERDSETGLDYFGARYYSNGLGRFITPDWAPKAVAVPYAEFADPQSLNLYTYVRNIPTTRLDADGHDGGVLAATWDLFTDGVDIGASAWAGGSVLLPGLIGGGLANSAISSLTENYTRVANATDLDVHASNQLVAAKAAAAQAATSSEKLRKEWEKLTGKPWPKTEQGKNFDAHHKEAKADGGSDTAENIEPKERGDHIDHHKKNGDFRRWGGRASKGGQKPPTPKPPTPEPPKQEPSKEKG